MAFQFKNLEKINRIVNEYPYRNSAILPLLKIAQKENNGYLSEEVIEYIADFFSVDCVKIMELVTFYSMLRTKPVSKNHIKICQTLSCQLNGAQEIKKFCEKHTIPFEMVECVGYCDKAPVVQFENEVYEKIDDVNILLKLKNI